MTQDLLGRADQEAAVHPLAAVPELVTETELAALPGYSRNSLEQKRLSGLVAGFRFAGIEWIHLPATARLDELNKQVKQAAAGRRTLRALNEEKLELDIAERRGKLVDVEIAREQAVKFCLALRADAEKMIVEVAAKLATEDKTDAIQILLVGMFDRLVESASQQLVASTPGTPTPQD